ncbi:MAG TPA: glycosyltransferase [Candidatus Dormibacteraeota bacterium]|nr:glycosyltransferase [Candidatus Dormibacteraeota bacterium]
MNVLMWESFAPGAPIRVGGHHYAERFVRRGDRVAWCVGPVSPVNLVKRNDETRRRLRLYRRGGESLQKGRLFAYAPMTLLPYRPYPLFDRPLMHRLTLRATVPRLRKVLARAGFERVDLLWMSTGSPFLALLDEVPHTAAVYRMSDDTAAFPDTPRSFPILETEICRRADLVVATARRLVARAREKGARRVLHLPNACDPGPFVAGGAEPEDIRTAARPRAVYAGAIDGWFDVALLVDTARRLPGWTFLLIGPQRADLSPLRALSNVRLLGPRPYADLPAYLKASDAGIVPFALNDLTHSIHPLKVYEYCAAALPVVATPMEETAAMGAPLRLAKTGEDFARALQQALAEDQGPRGEQARAERVAYARRNSWDGRFEILEGALASLTGRPVARAAGGVA